MNSRYEEIDNLYLSDEYMIENPSLHTEDSSWKVSKIIPLVDKFAACINKDEIGLLDVGGGAGLILNAISNYIRDNHKVEVSKFALDLSPRALDIQKKNNPNLSGTLNQDICENSLSNKAMDLTLMIDVLEHVTNPVEALKEAGRISHFLILKVPLEDNFVLKVWDFVRMGAYRQYLIKVYGHVNVYNFTTLRRQIEKHAGHVLGFYYTNVFDHYRNSEWYKGILKKLVNIAGMYVFRLSPGLCSRIFNDFVMILVKCY